MNLIPSNDVEGPDWKYAKAPFFSFTAEKRCFAKTGSKKSDYNLERCEI